MKSLNSPFHTYSQFFGKMINDNNGNRISNLENFFTVFHDDIVGEDNNDNKKQRLFRELLDVKIDNAKAISVDGNATDNEESDSD